MEEKKKEKLTDKFDKELQQLIKVLAIPIGMLSGIKLLKSLNK